jgi:cyanophycinase-like exopeptidase
MKNNIYFFHIVYHLNLFHSINFISYSFLIIRNAEAIFFAGGDQSDYTSLWPGTEVQSIIQGKLANVSVGGTSAGCAVEGNWIYTGEKVGCC